MSRDIVTRLALLEIASLIAFHIVAKPIYTVPTEEAALEALDQFETTWGSKYPLIIRSWRSNWGEIATFFKENHLHNQHD